MNNFSTEIEVKSGLEIAIVGMSGRFPGARNVDEFWQNLKHGVESIAVFTDEELLSRGIDAAILKNPDYVKAGAVLEDAELFDAAFFGFSQQQATITDPQLRLVLECAWQALEDAGYDSQQYQGAIAVYAGASLSSYLVKLLSNPHLRGAIDESQVLMSNDKDFLTTWVSYKLNLEGPSCTVQAACSTSLVAVHLACQDLLSGNCDLALAGGVSLDLPQNRGYLYQASGILSSDGHCRAFDANAQGTVYGSGVGIVVLKRLEDAIAEGDNIYAVIKGSAINNDGSAKASYSAPRVDSQAKVIKNAQFMAEIPPESITYIEAHGTGTLLGDMMEISAMHQAFRSSTEKTGFCAIGSVKTNIGHLKIAGGIAALIKTVLALKHKLIPPSLHFQQANPQIDFAHTPFYVNTQLSEWQINSTPRRAGVSSFGIGGTNAHVILEAAPDEQKHDIVFERSHPCHLLLLSAKTSSALQTATINLVNHLKQHPDLHLADVAYTLQVGRRSFEHRRMLVCQDIETAISALESPDSVTFYQEACSHSLVLVFPGEDSQYLEIGKELYSTAPLFREHIDYCCEQLQPHLNLDLRHILYASAEQVEIAPQQLQQTALFVVLSALAKLWLAWGIQIEAMIGCDIGEYIAAYLAGVFTLEDALVLVALRERTPQLSSEFTTYIQQVKLQPPRIPLISAITGTWIATTEVTNPTYWVQQMHCKSISLSPEIQNLMQEPKRIFLEIGTGKILNSWLLQQEQVKSLLLTSIPDAQTDKSETDFLLNTLGKLWLKGVQIDWSSYYAHEKRHRLSLPTYPFERQYYSIDSLVNNIPEFSKKSGI
ncbi:type I polyketide synthase [Calothrix sp. PCC 7507]|uniref:type I polyketide synthase n=1 Tax=Calothrix sp. PCC 7507 TaxID=99598 RepID=UPI00029F4679|nr:type I polyketide synthase [Calothrix sp. PCC 7507]AFY33178.1 6-deoxyerythronolide-B synthase [Calothrix sp. PCC 7507]